jgi:hypothetical protein
MRSAYPSSGGCVLKDTACNAGRGCEPGSIPDRWDYSGGEVRWRRGGTRPSNTGYFADVKMSDAEFPL